MTVHVKVAENSKLDVAILFHAPPPAFPTHLRWKYSRWPSNSTVYYKQSDSGLLS